MNKFCDNLSINLVQPWRSLPPARQAVAEPAGPAPAVPLDRDLDSFEARADSTPRRVTVVTELTPAEAEMPQLGAHWQAQSLTTA